MPRKRPSLPALAGIIAALTAIAPAAAQLPPLQQQTGQPPLQQQWNREGASPVRQAPALPAVVGPSGQGQASLGQPPSGPIFLGQPAPQPPSPPQAQPAQPVPVQSSPPQPSRPPAYPGQASILQPPSVQAPSVPASPATPPQAAQAQPSASAPAQTAPGWPNVWLPAAAVKLQALDKVNAQASELTIKVGQSATFGSLTITVKSCMTRPPDQPADSAAYLDITDSHPDTPPFGGWMLRAEPSVSMMQNPVYDIRVAGCV